jgi:hypothetical protein
MFFFKSSCWLDVDVGVSTPKAISDHKNIKLQTLECGSQMLRVAEHDTEMRVSNENEGLPANVALPFSMSFTWETKKCLSCLSHCYLGGIPLVS